MGEREMDLITKDMIFGFIFGAVGMLFWVWVVSVLLSINVKSIYKYETGKYNVLYDLVIQGRKNKTADWETLKIFPNERQVVSHENLFIYIYKHRYEEDWIDEAILAAKEYESTYSDIKICFFPPNEEQNIVWMNGEKV